MDDVGLHLTQTASRTGQQLGRGLVAGNSQIALSALIGRDGKQDGGPILQLMETTID
jgi:hypothetical protein